MLGCMPCILLHAKTIWMEHMTPDDKQQLQGSSAGNAQLTSLLSSSYRLTSVSVSASGRCTCNRQK